MCFPLQIVVTDRRASASNSSGNSVGHVNQSSLNRTAPLWQWSNGSSHNSPRTARNCQPSTPTAALAASGPPDVEVSALSAYKSKTNLGRSKFFWTGRKFFEYRISLTHCYFIRLNPRKKGTFKFCLPALLGIHRNSKQKEFFRSSEGFLR